MRFRILLQLDRFEDDDLDDAEPIEVTNTEVRAQGAPAQESALTAVFAEAEKLLRARIASCGLVAGS